MSEKFSVAFNLTQPNGHPHDLLARLYREIGLSAVAAALEVYAPDERGAQTDSYIDQAHRAPRLGEERAA